MSFKHHWVTILVTTLITFSASVVLTVIQPMEYRSNFTVLAIDQNPNLDGYAAAKSAERLSQTLQKTIATTAFADQVYAQLKDRADLAGNTLLSADVQTRRDAWKKEVTSQAFPDVGQVKISVFQRDAAQATSIANSISIAVAAYGNDYLGGSKDVVLKIVDSPLTSKTPVRPNVFANLAVGLILGFGGSIAFFLLTAPQATVQPMMFAPMMPTMLPSVPMATQTPVAPDMDMPMHEPVPVRHRREPRRATTPVAAPAVAQAPIADAPTVTEEPRIVSTPTPPVAPQQTPTNLPVIDEWVMP